MLGVWAYKGWTPGGRNRDLPAGVPKLTERGISAGTAAGCPKETWLSRGFQKLYVIFAFVYEIQFEPQSPNYKKKPICTKSGVSADSCKNAQKCSKAHFFVRKCKNAGLHT